MCTVSIVPHADGVRMLCNRDERRSRASAEAPSACFVNGRRAVFPVDPEGGGTWIGVNDGGVAAALLNRTVGRGSRRAIAPRRSRGAIVPLVLGIPAPEEALYLVRQLDPDEFASYRLAVLYSTELWIITGGGGAAADVRYEPLTAPRVLASSSLGDHLVEPARRRLFRRLLSAVPGDPLLAQQRFHHHQWPAHPSISVVMQREDACTVSRTQVDAPGMAMRYEEVVSSNPIGGRP